MTNEPRQVEVSGYVRTDNVNSRSTFSFLIDADEWSNMTDEDRDQTVLGAMLESISWDYDTHTENDWVKVSGKIKTDIVNSESTFEDNFLLDEWGHMSEEERDQAVLDWLLTCGAIEWDYTPPDVKRAVASP